MANGFRRIVKVARLGDQRLALVFDDDTVVLASFSQAAAKGGIFARLVDTEYFKRVRIAQGGRSLAWPQGLDFCADALYGPTRRTRTPRQTPYGVQVFPEAAVLC
jgi:hypothetical protein